MDSFDATRAVVERYAPSLGVDGIAVAVIVTAAIRDLVYSSDDVATRIDELQFTLGTGPCLDAFRSEQTMISMVGTDEGSPWPLFDDAVRALDVGAVFALPVGTEPTVGVLELYRRDAHPWSPVTAARAARCAGELASAVRRDVAGVGDGADDPLSRASVHVAAGMMAARFRITADEAVVRLRSLAYADGIRVTQLADDIVARRVELTDALLD
ncbi:ANTAR domain-containing protein [Rhodococcus sp. BP-316]|uniref:ANTAR domain-containing protein n=1 Tax=unclassified Rhodococcus (in: high G+C Gram-positive bacteria) TaxID=192944 RepID=UPI001C9A4617|nr:MULTISPECIES: ANTAR domain-containing protein [unclassified Rhodococcus (in: high G+C Gram-positive bacteria)]MBY6680937.1 ANTAR domain-containing protein [Rhodococcus sp. BP-316]MBY6706812.1 ANTAR domain-containing protein [Rhodococcus sp. BP-241]